MDWSEKCREYVGKSIPALLPEVERSRVAAAYLAGVLAGLDAADAIDHRIFARLQAYALQNTAPGPADSAPLLFGSTARDLRDSPPEIHWKDIKPLPLSAYDKPLGEREG